MARKTEFALFAPCDKYDQSVLAMFTALQEIVRIVIDLDDPDLGWRDMDATDVDQHLASIWRRATDALVRVTFNAEGVE